MGHDFIIVGAGAAGCVLANRLSGDPSVSVLLIESGGADSHPWIHLPRGFTKALAVPGLTHSYPVLRHGRNEPETWFRGRTLGGSTAVNGMMYLRGFARDYDEWAEQGCAGWGWSEIGRCFRELESGPGGFRTSLHMTGNELDEAVIRAAGEMGLPIVEDTNASNVPGFGYGRRSIWRGRRTTAATAFLHPVRGRRNLTVLTDTDVERVAFEGSRAVGVVVKDKAGRRTLNGREVILSAGALASPKLLMLSGIGPGAHLRRLGIEVLKDAPQVGRNLRDHLGFPMQFRVRRGSANREFHALRLVANALRAALLRSGPLTHGATEFGGFVKVRAQADRPDVQLLGSPVTVDRTGGKVAIEREGGFSLSGWVLRPESHGELGLQSPDPAQPPLIRADFMSHPIDQEVTLGMVRFIRDLAHRPALAPYLVEETQPGAEMASDEEILHGVNARGRCAFHTIGTCRMGADEAAVVDPRLRVRGVDGLRVADISVAPTMVSGNTQAPALAMAWRAAELIREDCAGAA